MPLPPPEKSFGFFDLPTRGRFRKERKGCTKYFCNSYLKRHFDAPHSAGSFGVEDRSSKSTWAKPARADAKIASRIPIECRDDVQLGGNVQKSAAAALENEAKAATPGVCPDRPENIFRVLYRRHRRRERGGPPAKNEVQLGKRTGGKRGAPFGNTNRLKHGRYTRARAARRAWRDGLLRSARNLARRLEMMAWSRQALRRKCARSTSPLSGGRKCGAFGGPVQTESFPHPKNPSDFSSSRQGGGGSRAPPYTRGERLGSMRR